MHDSNYKQFIMRFHELSNAVMRSMRKFSPKNLKKHFKFIASIRN